MAKPCQRCGKCCKGSICGLGARQLGIIDPLPQGPCPFLKRENNNFYSCDLYIKNPEFAYDLRIGEGCIYF